MPDASTIALQALGWVLQDDGRSQRLLDLTGLTPDNLRSAIGEPSLQVAVLDFLANYEPDLIGASKALDIAPETILNARRELSE